MDVTSLIAVCIWLPVFTELNLFPRNYTAVEGVRNSVSISAISQARTLGLASSRTGGLESEIFLLGVVSTVVASRSSKSYHPH